MDQKHLQRNVSIVFLVLTFFISSCFGSYQEKPISYKGQTGSFAKMVRMASAPSGSPKVVNVDDFGAKADGTDDTQAFERAWKEACASRTSVTFVVPKQKTFVLKPLTFSGPCHSDIIFKIYGTLKASNRMEDYEEDRMHWLVFDNIKNLRVRGGGIINGHGNIWWKNSCKIDKSKPCKHAPTAVTFYECKNLIVSNLWFQDAQQMHLTIQKCVNVRILKVKVTAPGNSPNTDGIHVTGTRNIRIRKSLIKTGDDCISIVSGSKNVEATDISCGPGHGISIGSLGADNSVGQVSNVYVNRATISGTSNGVRIKTWQGGSGYVKNVIFQNILMKNVSNPIIVDQNYCDQDDPCQQQKSAVKVSNVIYRNIRGTSASKVAMKFDCSETFPCQKIMLQNINLSTQQHQPAQASCSNVNMGHSGTVFPQCTSN